MEEEKVTTEEETLTELQEENPDVDMDDYPEDDTHEYPDEYPDEDSDEELEEDSEEEAEMEFLPAPPLRRKQMVLLLLSSVLVLFLVYSSTSLIYKVSRGESWNPFAFLKKTATTEKQLPTVPTVPAQVLTSFLAESSRTDSRPAAASSAATAAASSKTASAQTSAAAPSSETSSEASSAGTAAATTASGSSAATSAATATARTTTAEPLTSQAASTEPPRDFTLLREHLQLASLTEDQLSGSQLIIAQGASEDRCFLYFFEKKDGAWSPSEVVPVATATLNKRKIVSVKPAGSTDIPAGYFQLGPVFGHEKAVLTHMPYQLIQSNDCWVIDPSSNYYNQLVQEKQKDRDWKRTLELNLEQEAFQYAILIQYNTKPVNPDLGTAVFLNVSTDARADASISTNVPTLFGLLKWLDPTKEPHILIYAYETDSP